MEQKYKNNSTFGFFCIDKLSYCVKKKYNKVENEGEMLLDVSVGDIVMIYWKDKM